MCAACVCVSWPRSLEAACCALICALTVCVHSKGSISTLCGISHRSHLSTFISYCRWIKSTIYALCVCVCVGVSGCVCNTCDLVQALSGDMIVLIDPFPITLEVDLGGGGRPAPQLDRPVLYDESVLWFQQEFWERFCRR